MEYSKIFRINFGIETEYKRAILMSNIFLFEIYEQRKKKEMIRIFFPTKFQIDPTLIMIENKTIPTL